jgi:hypothetical protein
LNSGVGGTCCHFGTNPPSMPRNEDDVSRGTWQASQPLRRDANATARARRTGPRRRGVPRALYLSVGIHHRTPSGPRRTRDPAGVVGRTVAKAAHDGSHIARASHRRRALRRTPCRRDSSCTAPFRARRFRFRSCSGCNRRRIRQTQRTRQARSRDEATRVKVRFVR